MSRIQSRAVYAYRAPLSVSSTTVDIAGSWEKAPLETHFASAMYSANWFHLRLCTWKQQDSDQQSSDVCLDWCSGKENGQLRHWAVVKFSRDVLYLNTDIEFSQKIRRVISQSELVRLIHPHMHPGAALDGEGDGSAGKDGVSHSD